MISITWIGMAAACCTTIAFIPQVVQILRTGNVDGISLGMYSIFTTGIALWLVYGILLEDLPIVAANLITLALCLIDLPLDPRPLSCILSYQHDDSGRPTHFHPEQAFNRVVAYQPLG